ncbi:MAG TPA: hypothetical protein VFB73_00385 [Chloroflexota bacterium]|nr:hypothetical protein [Chloroflexota bacterium]
MGGWANALGSLTDEGAQQLAAFIGGQPWPVFAGKAQDYPDGQVPVDAVYYPSGTRAIPSSGEQVALSNRAPTR